jgi:hypothetical protein
MDLTVPPETIAEQVLLERIQEEGAQAAGADEPRPVRKRFDNLSDLLLGSRFAGATSTWRDPKTDRDKDRQSNPSM